MTPDKYTKFLFEASMILVAGLYLYVLFIFSPNYIRCDNEDRGGESGFQTYVLLRLPLTLNR